MSSRRVLFLGVVIVASVVAALLFRSHGGRREAPPADAPPELAPRTAAPPAPPTGAPGAPTVPASVTPSAALPAPTADRTDAGVPNSRAQALHEALIAAKDASGGRLYADIARTGRPIPPQARKLVEMKEAGLSAADLSAYVNGAFPPDEAVRKAALKWLRLHTPDPLPATDAGAQARSRIFRTTPAP